MHYTETFLYFVLFAYIVTCVPVQKTVPKTKHGKLVSDEFRQYLENLTTSLENSTEFLEHVSNLHEEHHDVNISLISDEVREKLNQIKFQTRNYIMELQRARQNIKNGLHVKIPSDLARALDIGNSSEFTAMDIEQIMKMLRDRQNVIDREEILFLNEMEIMNVLARWESHMNISLSERNAVQKEYEETKKSHSKSNNIHVPGSRNLELEQWRNGDDLPESAFDPRLFFHLHDLNSDEFWDVDEVEALVSIQVEDMHPESPEQQQEYLIEMRQRIFEALDANNDSLISLEEHMNHMNSPEGKTDDRWQPDDDFDDVGPLPNEIDLAKLENKIKEFDAVNPGSRIVKRLRQRLERIKFNET